MKELSIEEKARAYDEALERAKKVNKCEADDREPGTSICEYIFPELAESNDEKIRKALIDGFTVMKESKNCGKTFSNHNIPVADILAWLEKQGEHKLPIEKLPEEMKTIGESLEFTTQEECDEYNQMVSGLIMSDDNKEEQKQNVDNKKLTDVNHEYFSELLENDDSKDINDYAYQVAYCMSHDWLEETATWEDVQKAVKLGAEWQKQKLTWSEEDEEIRKWIINEIKIKHHNLDEDNVDFVDKAIAWLEKQGKEDSSIQQAYEWGYTEGKRIERKHWIEKQNFSEDYNSIDPQFGKPINKVEPKFKDGDWVVFNDKHESVYQIEKIENFQYILRHILGGSMPLSFSGEDMIRPWAIQDARDGDVLACNEEILLFKSYSVQGRISLYCWYNGQTNNFHSKEVVDTLMTTRNKIYPATKEQRDILFSKMKEAGYEWDENNKILKEIVEDEEEPQNYKNQVMSEITDLVKHYIKQKPACSEASEDIKEALRTEYEKGRADAFAQMQKEWSEEDEKCIRLSTDIIDSALRAGFCVQLDRDRCIDWFNSLKERYIWKPSYKQIAVLKIAADGCADQTVSQILSTLYKDLKKLKGE